uniref:Metalloendopeptidase n=1 Tax=Strongyloides venezuelensis TaxID=75913 RepID=A0A0K0FEJ5_STRVS
MKQFFFVIIFISLLILESLSKKSSKKSNKLKNPPPYVRSGTIHVYVHKNESLKNVRAILYHISTRTCLNFTYDSSKIKGQSGINIYKTSKQNSLKVSYSKKKPTFLKLKNYILQHKSKLAFYIGRALGMIPEISRPDRDEYVKINWGNIKKSHRKYYQKTKYNYTYYKDVEFDFGSIMLVDSSFGSKDKNKPTYTFKINQNFHKIDDPYYVFSHNNLKFLNGMYCRNHCSKNDCLNGGYYLRDCDSCECPFHFYGLKCGTPKYSIGDCLEQKEYIAEDFTKHFEHYDRTGKCSYHIKSNFKDKIKVIITKLQLPNSKCTSSDSYVDILYRNDKGTTGLTICKSVGFLEFKHESSEIFIFINALKKNDSMYVNYKNDNFLPL